MGNEEMLRAVGERISGRRKQLKMTQEELAARMDVSTQMISYAEQGRKAMRPENLAKLCAALQISADYILTGKPGIAEYDRISAKLELGLVMLATPSISFAARPAIVATTSVAKETVPSGLSLSLTSGCLFSIKTCLLSFTLYYIRKISSRQMFYAYFIGMILILSVPTSV